LLFCFVRCSYLLAFLRFHTFIVYLRFYRHFFFSLFIYICLISFSFFVCTYRDCMDLLFNNDNKISLNNSSTGIIFIFCFLLFINPYLEALSVQCPFVLGLVTIQLCSFSNFSD